MAGFPQGALGLLAGSWPAGSYTQVEGAAATSAMVADTSRYTALWVPRAAQAVEIQIDTTVAGVGGAPTMRVGFFLPDSFGRPGALLADLGTIDVSVAPGILPKTIAQTVPAGLLWLSTTAQGATVTQPTVRAVGGWTRWTNPTSLTASSANRGGYVEAGITGALPATATPVLTGSVSPPPWVALKAAS